MKEFVETTDKTFDSGTENLSTDNEQISEERIKAEPDLRFAQNEKIEKDIASKKYIVNILYGST